MVKGKIIKGIGGFYYVETAEAVYECKARGNFRKQNISPLVGDDVEIALNEKGENRIESILPRKNSLVRPPIANLDQLFIVASIVDPDINLFIVDKLIAISEFKNIEPIIVLTKIDLADNYREYQQIYEKAGFKTIVCNNITGDGAEKVKCYLKGKTSAFTGNTGVGKSSLLNAIDSSLSLATGETSKKLGRGKHTTRHSELFNVSGGYVADTPGFSSLDFERCEKILKDDLFDCFRDFAPYFGMCKFSTCSHINEKGCAVCEAVKNGEIQQSRHNSYIQMYNDVKDIKEWELKKVKCTIVSGSTENDYEYLKNNIDKSSFVIAADSGYLKCINSGIIPDLIIGDFDSAGVPELDCEIISLPVEKDDSDTFYCIKEAHKRGFTEIEIFNAIGDRLDHTYSNILCLEYCRKNNIKAFIKNRKNKISIIDDEIVIDDKEYKYFSVFSYSDVSTGLSIKNAYYPLENYTMHRFDQIGQSNHFNGEKVKISVKNGIIIVIQSND